MISVCVLGALTGLQRQTQSGSRLRPPPDHVSSLCQSAARRGPRPPARHVLARCVARLPRGHEPVTEQAGRVLPAVRGLSILVLPAGVVSAVRQLRGLRPQLGALACGAHSQRQRRDPRPPALAPPPARGTHRSPPPANTWPPTRRAAAQRGTGATSERRRAVATKQHRRRPCAGPKALPGHVGLRGWGERTGATPVRCRVDARAKARLSATCRSAIWRRRWPVRARLGTPEPHTEERLRNSYPPGAAY